MPKTLKSFSKNYEGFLKVNTRSYRGEWIALVGKRVVAHGKRADTTYQKAVQKHPRLAVSLAKVPETETLAWAQTEAVPALLGREDIFDTFLVLFKQRQKEIVFRE